MGFLVKKEFNDDAVISYLSCDEQEEGCEKNDFNGNVVYSDLNSLQLMCSAYKGIGTGLDIDRAFYLLVTSCTGLAVIFLYLLIKVIGLNIFLSLD